MNCPKCGTEHEVGFCPECGAPASTSCANCQTVHSAKFCPSCGKAAPEYTVGETTLSATAQPAFQPSPPASNDGIKCPKCGSSNLHPVVETSVTAKGKTKGFGAGKGCLGFLVLGPLGWLCGLCGMGKGKTKTTSASTTYWMCGQCSNKFKA